MYSFFNNRQPSLFSLRLCQSLPLLKFHTFMASDLHQRWIWQYNQWDFIEEDISFFLCKQMSISDSLVTDRSPCPSPPPLYQGHIWHESVQPYACCCSHCEVMLRASFLQCLEDTASLESDIPSDFLQSLCLLFSITPWALRGRIWERHSIKDCVF